MANKKDRKINFECYSFNSILDYRKWVIFFTSVHFVSSEYEPECGNTIHFIQKLTFKESCCLWGSSLHAFEICFWCFSIFYAPKIVEWDGGILFLSCLSFCPPLWNFNLANNFWTLSASWAHYFFPCGFDLGVWPIFWNL